MIINQQGYGVDGGGDKENEIIARTLSGTYSNSTVTSIGSYAFYGCTGLISVSFAACIRVKAWAFVSCNALTTVSFPACTSIESAVFQTCRSLTTALFPACTTINSWVFNGCSRLSIISFPMVQNIMQYAFYGCLSLTTISFPSCTSIGASAFRQCSYLGAVYLSWTGTNTTISSLAFANCWRLKSLYLLGSQVRQLQNIDVFSSTPISTYTTYTDGQNGSIYVPSSLYASYIASTNWVTYSARFVSLTDAEVSTIKVQMGL